MRSSEVFISLILISFSIFIMLKQSKFYETFNLNLNLSKTQSAKQMFDFNFIPKDLKFCEDLYSDTFSSSNNSSSSSIRKPFNMSAKYQFHLPAYEEAVDAIIKSNNPITEGDTFELWQQYMLIHHLARHSFVRTVCETGFNIGHSSFNYLTANNQLSVYSFDLGAHPYASLMYVFLKAMFPGRLSVYFGNSVEALPKFIAENTNVKCDVMLVDGGHYYDVALADVTNFARIANLERNVIVFDDCPTELYELRRTWTEVIAAGFVEETFRCNFRSLKRGFIIGRFLRRP